MSMRDERIRKLLKQAMPPVESDREPRRDLWPSTLRRLDAVAPKAPIVNSVRSKWVWFDWALLAGLAAMVLAFPASIPLLLYYL